MTNSAIDSSNSPLAAAHDQDVAGGKRLRCGTCQRGFSKAEHLERHERSHLKQKPFTCLTCAKSFGRKDVLSRHEKRHEALSNPKAAAQSSALSTSEAVGGVQAEEVVEQIRHPINMESASGVFSNSSAHESPMSMASVSQATALPQSWMESGDMLEMLMSDFTTSWPLSLPLSLPAMPNQLPLPALNPISSYHQGSISQIQPLQTTGPGHQAMDQMSRLISELSASLTAEIQNKGITSNFLDTCVHVFFDRFIPSFPILNKATFNVRESSHPLLLNIMALGSLFVGAKDAILKGECLWRLAHTAVATNWNRLMATRGPKDRCNGIQLVLTALTGQTYAILSQNESIRSTAQIFHGLGFFWAKQCGMYNDDDVIPSIPRLDASQAEKLEAWKVWMAHEIQNRAVLGHYILDGHISNFSGNASCARHVINPLSLPSDDAFTANSADDWIRKMEKTNSSELCFREIFTILFSSNVLAPVTPLSNFALRVILEGLQSLVSDISEANGPAVGTPSKAEISHALIRMYNIYLCPGDRFSVDTVELLIRWHSVCLDLATRATKLCRDLCALYFIQQRLHDETHRADVNFNLTAWSHSADARRALLHSIAIQDLIEQLPLGRSQVFHLPAAIFAAGTIYSAFCLASISSIIYPARFGWDTVWVNESFNNIPSGIDDGIDAFLQGKYRNRDSNSKSRNLMYELNSLQIILNSLSRWGVSIEMGAILQSWISTASNEP